MMNIDTCSLLVEVNISCWTARKLDKSTTEEVVRDKSAASKDAARVNKSLLAGRTELKELEQMAGAVRTFVYDNTMPWSNNGLRLLPTLNFTKFDARMKEMEQQFADKVRDFLSIYPTLITAQAMALGDMFRRDDYPLPIELENKFAFSVGYLPVPSSGDFRVDVGNEAQAQLKETLEKITEQRVNDALSSVWEKLGAHVKRMSDRLTVDVVGGEEKQRVFHDTLLETAWDLVESIKAMNIVNDPVLEDARKGLERVISGVTIEELRKNPAVKRDVKAEVDALLGKFAF